MSANYTRFTSAQRSKVLATLAFVINQYAQSKDPELDFPHFILTIAAVIEKTINGDIPCD